MSQLRHLFYHPIFMYLFSYLLTTSTASSKNNQDELSVNTKKSSKCSTKNNRHMRQILCLKNRNYILKSNTTAKTQHHNLHLKSLKPTCQQVYYLNYMFPYSSNIWEPRAKFFTKQGAMFATMKEFPFVAGTIWPGFNSTTTLFIRVPPGLQRAFSSHFFLQPRSLTFSPLTKMGTGRL